MFKSKEGCGTKSYSILVTIVKVHEDSGLIYQPKKDHTNNYMKNCINILWDLKPKFFNAQRRRLLGIHVCASSYVFVVPQTALNTFIELLIWKVFRGKTLYSPIFFCTHQKICFLEIKKRLPNAYNENKSLSWVVFWGIPPPNINLNLPLAVDTYLNLQTTYEPARGLKSRSLPSGLK